MVKKTKGTKASIYTSEGDLSGRTDVGLKCIGEICFNEQGFLIKLPEDADPECAKKTAELILRGNSNVVFEVPGKGIVKDPTKISGEDDDGEGN